MLDNFVPDMFYQSIFRIDYELLKKKGIKLLIFDLDNTISPVDTIHPSKEVIDLMFDIKELGIRPVLMSNSGRKRVEYFRNELEIDTCASARKPLKKNYKKILKLYKMDNSEVACIGDQLLTDIYGANKMEFTSILVNPISKKDLPITYFNRFIEKILMIKLKEREIFSKGKYYE